MRNPFLFAAGVDEATISRCSTSEKNKYITLGMLIYVPLATSIIAVIFTSLYFTHNPLTIFLVCLVWGSVVFTIERALISSLRPHKFNFAVVFRVISAFAMSLIISELLIMFVFQDQIQKHIGIQVEREIKDIHEKYENRIAQLHDGLKTYEEDLSKQETSLIEEIEGISGSLKKGDGKVATEKRKALERKKTLLNEEKLRVNNEIMLLRDQEKKAVNACDLRREAGLLGSIVGLQQLSNTNNTVFWVLLIAHIFFLTVELMPLVIKMSFKGTQYYDLIDLNESQHLDVARQLSNDNSRILFLEGQHQLELAELGLRTKSVQADISANIDQFSCISETLLKAAQQISELEQKASSTVAEQKLELLKNQLDGLYSKMLQSVKVEAAV